MQCPGLLADVEEARTFDRRPLELRGLLFSGGGGRGLRRIFFFLRGGGGARGILGLETGLIGLRASRSQGSGRVSGLVRFRVEV